MNDVPLVSIVIPAYNHEKYVQECIQSVIDQDYPRIELIVIDDGSTDGTWARIQEMRSACERRFERVVMETQRNQGCSATCRRLESLERGEIAGGIASDDRYAPGAISKLVRPLVENDDIGLCVGTNIVIDAEGRHCYWDALQNNVYDEDAAVYKTADALFSYCSGVDFDSDDFGTYETLIHLNYIPNGHLVKRSVCGGCLHDPAAPLEDWWFHLQLSKKTRYLHIDDVTFCYRWHGANSMCDKEKMTLMAEATILHERETLLAAGDSEWLRIARKDFRCVRVVKRLNLGPFRLSVKEVCDFDYCRRSIKVLGLRIPLSRKKRW